MSDIHTRLIELIKYSTGGNKRKFEIKCNLSNAFVDKTIKRKTEPKRETLEEILNAHPEINREWLIEGKGEMKKERPKVITSHSMASPEELKIIEAIKDEMLSDQSVTTARKQVLERMWNLLSELLSEREYLKRISQRSN